MMTRRFSHVGLLALAICISPSTGCHSTSGGIYAAPNADSIRAAQNRHTRTSATEVVQFTDDDRARYTHVALMIQARFSGVRVSASGAGYAVTIRGRASLSPSGPSSSLPTTTGQSSRTSGTSQSSRGSSTSPSSRTSTTDQASITSNTEPLVVVDGIIRGGQDELGNINPRDVDRIEIIKDGAAAFYGSRGANGVIAITTRRSPR